MIYFIAFTLGISGAFHPCFIGTITTFYAALVLIKDRKKFILGSILGIIIINFSFLFFTDFLSHILHQKIFNYIIGGMFIFFGLMFLEVIKHKHAHFLLSVEKIEKTNPILMGIFITFSWIQSFAHIFIPMVPLISKTNPYLRIFIILPYILGLTIPVTLFNFLPLRFKEKYRHKYNKIIGILLIILGMFITFNLFEEIEHLI
ncbi:cytochrome c biogenesis protein CcdA [Psychrilyobacter sp.]|uniref:cytochrome c biogenesis protein CcdA n=1 Tax=Psychrilyobacter sp. TaxID=2586924 RepID=UPI0030166564